MVNMSKVYCEKIDLENIDLKKVYTFEEFENINNKTQLNRKPVNLFEYKNGKLIPIVAEIALQKKLIKYNEETLQNLTREHEERIKTNNQLRHEINNMKAQVQEIEEALVIMKSSGY